jgi:cytochrome c biogenesis protein CcdA
MTPLAKNAGPILAETSSLSFLITTSIVLGAALTLILKGLSYMSYAVSFLIGCVPITVAGFFRPILNPYVNLWTRREENSLSEDEISNLKLLKGPDCKGAVFTSMIAVAAVMLSLYLGIVLVSQYLLIRPRDTYDATVVGSFFTFWLSFAYQIFFLSRMFCKEGQG